MATFKNFLKKINSLPVSFSMKHYYPFGEDANYLKNKKLDSKESWDFLRTSHPSFSISQNREEWLLAAEAKSHKDGQDGGLLDRAKDLTKVLDEIKAKSVFSVGVGGAGLEYQIKKLRPQIKIVCSEYSDVNVDLLKKVFIEADSIVQFDITNKKWPDNLKNKEEVCLIYRIDASFNDKEWREIFQNIHDAGVETVLYVPNNFLTILSIFIRLSKRLSWKLKGQPFIFSGYLRTRKATENFWKGLYKQEFKNFGTSGGFVLKRIK